MKDASLLRMVKRCMGLPSASTGEESEVEEEDEVRNQVVEDGLESSRARDAAIGKDTGPSKMIKPSVLKDKLRTLPELTD